MHTRKITAPIARSTAYDFNCHLPGSHTKSTSYSQSDHTVPCKDQEDLNINEHELLFNFNSANLNVRRMRAASSLNNMTFPSDVKNAIHAHFNVDINSGEGRTELARQAHNNPAIERVLNEYVRYVGVAVTGCTGGTAGAIQRQGFSATRGGLNTIINTGQTTILPGQMIEAYIDPRDLAPDDTNRQMIEGIPKSKIVMRVRPLDHTSTYPSVLDSNGKPMSHSIFIEGSPLLPHVEYVARVL